MIELKVIYGEYVVPVLDGVLDGDEYDADTLKDLAKGIEARTETFFLECKQCSRVVEEALYLGNVYFRIMTAEEFEAAKRTVQEKILEAEAREAAEAAANAPVGDLAQAGGVA